MNLIDKCICNNFIILEIPSNDRIIIRNKVKEGDIDIKQILLQNLKSTGS